MRRYWSSIGVSWAIKGALGLPLTKEAHNVFEAELDECLDAHPEIGCVETALPLRNESCLLDERTEHQLEDRYFTSGKARRQFEYRKRKKEKKLLANKLKNNL